MGFEVIPVGIIRSPYKKDGEAPHQGRFSEEISEIEIFPEFEEGLRDIEKCTHLIVLYWFDRARRDKLTAVPPHDRREHGVFATRSPNRPNPIGFSVVKLLEKRGRILKVKWLDALDGTPVLDIKPYSSQIDSVEDAKIGWLEHSMGDLLIKAREFHGHICPFLAVGIRISLLAMEELGIRREEFASVSEELLAIVECNNCLTDGVQIATGCTFGNNSLIYLDLGKNALTLVRRKDWKGVRIYVDAENLRQKYFDAETLQLFEKVVVRREGSEEDFRRLSILWEKMGWKMLELKRDEFKIEFVEVEPIERAPIFESRRCRNCGELSMVTRIRDGLCLKCAGSYYAVVGRGIVRFESGKMEVL